MDMKKMTAMGLALALVAGGASLGAVSVAQAEVGKEKKSEAPAEKKDIKQGDKAPDAEEAKTRGFKKGQKPTETMGTMGKGAEKKDKTTP